MKLAAVGAEALVNLQDKLAGRRENEGMRPPWRTLQALRRKAVQSGRSEGRGLAGAGLGDTDQIPAFGEKREGLSLNRRRFEIVLGLERKPQRLGQAEAVERSGYHL